MNILKYYRCFLDIVHFYPEETRVKFYKIYYSFQHTLFTLMFINSAYGVLTSDNYILVIPYFLLSLPLYIMSNINYSNLISKINAKIIFLRIINYLSIYFIWIFFYTKKAKEYGWKGTPPVFDMVEVISRYLNDIRLLSDLGIVVYIIQIIFFIVEIYIHYLSINKYIEKININYILIIKKIILMLLFFILVIFFYNYIKPALRKLFSDKQYNSYKSSMYQLPLGIELMILIIIPINIFKDILQKCIAKIFVVFSKRR